MFFLDNSIKYFLSANLMIIGTSLKPIDLIIFVGIVIVLIFIIFYVSKSGKKNGSVLNKKTNQYKIRLKQAKIAYDKLKDDFERLTVIYSFDKKKIEELNSYVDELEEINRELQEKKLIAETKLARIEELKRKRDELFAINIHDLKNPINAIKGYTALVKDYDLTVDEQKEVMDSLLRSADRMHAIVSELTEVIRHDIESEKKTENVSLRHIGEEVCRNNAAYVKRKGINLLNKTQIDLPYILGDAGKIETAVDNLVNNAIKYGEEGTNIEIKTKFDDSSVILEVIDDGVGLTEEEQRLAFNKGETLSNEPTAGEDQSGLGLWIVRQIIEDHKGEVWVKSVKGEGSTFGLKLPRK